MRELILDEIRRLAKANGGQAPGVKAFTRDTGIGSHKWLGVYWARWGDALAEAGFAANEWNQRLDSAEVLNIVIGVIREARRLPNDKEWQLLRRARPSLPTSKLLRSHFGSRADLLATLQQRVREDPDASDIAPLLPTNVRAPPTAARSRSHDGSVYLVKSGNHYKIGRSDEIERRMKEIRIALPETAALIHIIRTDDPAGIEAYWHRRFADQRANGEWFKLSVRDVAAFRRRSYQ